MFVPTSAHERATRWRAPASIPFGGDLIASSRERAHAAERRGNVHPMPRENARRASIPFILVTVLIDMMGIGIVIPVLPTLVGHFTQDTETQAYWYGALTFTFGI